MTVVVTAPSSPSLPDPPALRARARAPEAARRELLDVPVPPHEHRSRRPIRHRTSRVAVILVNGFTGLGIHSVLSIQNALPALLQELPLRLRGRDRLGELQGRTRRSRPCKRLDRGGPREVRRVRAQARDEGRVPLSPSGRRRSTRSSSSASDVQKEFPRSIFYLGKLVFENDRFYYRLLHNETALAIQRRLQFAGLQAVVLPIRVLEPRTKAS